MKGQKPREIAFRVLHRRLSGRDFTETLLDQSLLGSQMSAADRSLCQELVYGVVRHMATLDWLIARKARGPRLKESLRILLQLGLYQLFCLSRIPDHAIVHETVQLAKELGMSAQAGFVNAVLRAYTREREATLSLLQTLKSSDPPIAFSHPRWLWKRWQKRWGAESAVQLMEWNNEPPGIFVRVNTLRTNAETLLFRWREEENVEYDFIRSEWLPENLVFELKSHPPFHRMKTFQEGCFYIQDPSTLLAVLELNPKPRESILDFCAAPGGKTTFISQVMKNEGNVVGQDTDDGRLKLLRENCARLGVTNVKFVETGPSIRASHLAPRFDKVLVDAPCSNTGVMRRRVDLRWRIQPQEIDRLRKAQIDLLHQAEKLVKPGGTLTYSTCSLEPEENEEVVNRFLKDSPNFELKVEKQLIPFRDRMDGAYVAKLTAPTSP